MVTASFSARCKWLNLTKFDGLWYISVCLKSLLVKRNQLIIKVKVGASTNGKSGDFGSPIWRFESSRPSQESEYQVEDKG